MTVNEKEAIEQAQVLLQDKVAYVRDLAMAVNAEKRIRALVKDAQSELQQLRGTVVESALETGIEHIQQAHQAAQQHVKDSRAAAKRDGGWTDRELSEMGLIPTRKRKTSAQATPPAAPAASTETTEPAASSPSPSAAPSWSQSYPTQA